MNTSENPTTKRTELTKRARRVREFATVPWSSSKEIPAMNERYEGKSGKTHGERNDRRPAATATRTFSSAPGIALLSSLLRDQLRKQLPRLRALPVASADRAPTDVSVTANQEAHRQG